MSRTRLIPLALHKTGGTLEIAEGGTYDVSRYSRVVIPNGFNPGDVIPIAFDNIRVITWSDFQNLDKSLIANITYSIKL